MLGVFAEFETNLRRERQAEGIAKAKRSGAYTGGKRRIDRDGVHRLAARRAWTVRDRAAARHLAAAGLPNIGRRARNVNPVDKPGARRNATLRCNYDFMASR